METFIVVARTLHFAACVSLAGEFAFECLVGGATLRVCGGDLRRRLSGLAWTSLGLALISGIAWLVGLAVTMSGQPLGQALHAGTLATVLTQTRVGEDWQLRFGFAVLLGASFVWSRRRGDASRGVAWLGLTLAVLLLVTLAWAGHGASDEGIDGDIHLAADLLHLLTAGLWLGGLVPFVLLLAAARQSRDADAVVAMRSATHRFSVVAVVSVGVLLLSGVVNTWYLSGSMPALLGTTYGQLLLLKIGLFLVMLTVAAVNRLRLTPRLGGTEPARAATQLQRNALLETAIGLGILAIVGAIGTMAPGLHTEPVWPLPFRLDTNALSTGAAILLLIFATALCVCIVTVVVAFATGRKRLLGAAIVGLIVCIAFGGAPAAPALVVAYPTTFFAPPVPYDATAVVHGAVVYAQNCAVCHGADGRGDGPAAASLPIKPADLVEAHLFAHNVGDLYWWIGHGLGGVMPPFRGTLSPNGSLDGDPLRSRARRRRADGGRRTGGQCRRRVADAGLRLRKQRRAGYAQPGAREGPGTVGPIRLRSADGAAADSGEDAAEAHCRRRVHRRGRSRHPKRRQCALCRWRVGGRRHCVEVISHGGRQR